MESPVDATPSVRMTEIPPATASLVNGVFLARWRMLSIGLLRIVFGLVWGIDAWFKWQPDFINNFSGYLMGTLDGQPM